MIFCIFATNVKPEKTQRAIYEIKRRIADADVAVFGDTQTSAFRGGVKLRSDLTTTEQALRLFDRVDCDEAVQVDLDTFLAGQEGWATVLKGEDLVWEDAGPLTLETIPNVEAIPEEVFERDQICEREELITSLRENSELGFVLTYFNPCGYKRLLANVTECLERFSWMADRIVVAECAFFDQPFVIDHPNVIRFRTSDVLWHKEAMINEGGKLLRSRGFQNIGWLDGDVTIDNNEEWYSACVSALENHSYIQVFSDAIHRYDDEDNVKPGAVEEWIRGENPIACYKTGLGWAVRGNIFDGVKFYDYGILGSGDRLAWLGSFDEESLSKELTAVPQFSGKSIQLSFFQEWSRLWRSALRKQSTRPIGKVDGRLIAAPHGKRVDRNYCERERTLNHLDYNPRTHVERKANGLLGWTETTPRSLKKACLEYFLNRNEDHLLVEKVQPVRVRNRKRKRK